MQFVTWHCQASASWLSASRATDPLKTTRTCPDDTCPRGVLSLLVRLAILDASRRPQGAICQLVVDRFGHYSREDTILSRHVCGAERSVSRGPTEPHTRRTFFFHQKSTSPSSVQQTAAWPSRCDKTTLDKRECTAAIGVCVGKDAEVRSSLARKKLAALQTSLEDTSPSK